MSLIDDINLQVARLSMRAGAGSRVRIYRQLERLVRNNVPIKDALQSLYNRASKNGKKPNNSTAMAITAWKRGTSSGAGLSAAMRGWIPESERILIESGEQGGELARALGDVTDLALGAKQIRGAIIAGMAYPVMLFASLLGTLWYLGNTVIPALGNVLDPKEWQGAGAWLASLATFAENWTIPIAIATPFLFGLYLFSLPRRWPGKLRIYADRFPPYSFYRMSQGVGFLLSTAGLLRSNMLTRDILDRLSKDATPYMRDRMQSTKRIYIQGHNLGESLVQSGYEFPDRDIVQDLQTYAELDGFENQLGIVAREWLVEVVKKVESQAGLINMALLFLIFIIISLVFAGLYAVTGQIGAAAQTPGGIM